MKPEHNSRDVWVYLDAETDDAESDCTALSLLDLFCITHKLGKICPLTYEDEGGGGAVDGRADGLNGLHMLPTTVGLQIWFAEEIQRLQALCAED